MYLLLTCLFVLASSAFCRQTGSFDLSPRVTSTRPAIQQRFNFFDVELMRYAGETYTGNFLLSPASIKSTLAMLLEGAQGLCSTELRRALRLPEDPQEMRQQLNSYLASLRVFSPGIALESSNRIFLSRKYNVIKTYQKLLTDIYFSEVQLVNFEDPVGTASSINDWISRQTHGLITDLVDPFTIEANSVMVLANALYFKGKWKNSFDEEDTHPHCFHTESGCQEVFMMENQGDFKYGLIPEINAQAIEIPYQGDTYSMLILLPSERFGASAVIKDLPFMSVPQILSQMEVMDVQLSLPRFNMDFSENIVDVLQKVGINLIFTAASNLTGIVQGDQSPLVNNIFHKTKIEVNEEGSIAAAGTGAMVIPLMGTNTARVLIDHPFLFFIMDVSTGAIIFEGRVDLPELVGKPSNQPSLVQNVKKPLNQPTMTVNNNRNNQFQVQQGSTPNSSKQGSNSQTIQNSQTAKPIPSNAGGSVRPIAQTKPASAQNHNPVDSQNYNQQTNSVGSQNYYPQPNPVGSQNYNPPPKPVAAQNYNPQTNPATHQQPNSEISSTSVNQNSQHSQGGYGAQSVHDEPISAVERFASDDDSYEFPQQ